MEKPGSQSIYTFKHRVFRFSLGFFIITLTISDILYPSHIDYNESISTDLPYLVLNVMISRKMLKVHSNSFSDTECNVSYILKRKCLFQSTLEVMIAT